MLSADASLQWRRICSPLFGRRTIVRIPGAPVNFGAGRFWFEIQRPGSRDEWTTVTRLPLELVSAAPPGDDTASERKG